MVQGNATLDTAFPKMNIHLHFLELEELGGKENSFAFFTPESPELI